ncbi:heterokaryon incompatibility protein-domain-containing protein, partial [Diaporthe sp. PMI_573]
VTHTYIRLLQICSIDELRDVSVHCKLTLWAFDAAPAYIAISYTWGDQNLLEPILVDGKTMEARQNCGYVLRKAWRLKGSGYIWIDAICINQIDNNEKSHQVAMMGSVYQKAVRTLACVGLHENDSEFLCAMLHKKSSW